jgi:SAM-dependent methyltransferase
MSWSLDIKEMSWVEHTREEVDFVVEALGLRGGERILDLACGFGRHSLELARRGYRVVGVDVTPDYVADARASARAEGLAVEFREANALDVDVRGEFDAVLSLADGAIGYFDTEEENLRLFDVVAAALRPGGRHVLGVCSADHARAHFPKRHWEAGTKRLSLADFRWNEATSRMIYRGHLFKYGDPLPAIADAFPEEPGAGQRGTRLYGRQELERILAARGLEVMNAFGGYDVKLPASPDRLMLVVVSRKLHG